MKQVLLMVIISLTMLIGAVPPKRVLHVDKSRTINIRGEVSGGILRQAKKLYELSSVKKPVYLMINSPGGSVYAGLQFINAMRVAKARGVEIRCFVSVLAASMAFQILAECDRRYALEYSLLLWHPMSVSTRQSLDSKQLKELHEDMKTLEEPMIKILIRKLKISKKIFMRHYRNQTLFTTLWLQKVAPGFIEIVDDIEGVKIPI